MVEFGRFHEIKDCELDLMRSWRNAPNVRANMYTRHEISESEHLAWWAKVKNCEDQKYLLFESQGQPAGIVAFTGIDRVNLNSSWAFYASPSAAKGIGTKMEFMALDYAFDDLGLHKLWCEVLAFNEPVIKLHQKFGFQVEGIFREQHRVDGKFTDIYRLGIQHSEWLTNRPAMKTKIESFLTR